MSESLTVETWRTIEIELAADADHPHPLAMDVDAIFTSSLGDVVRRPVFWDGGRTWRVRFAAPVAAEWEMVIRSSVADGGLTGATARILSVPYAGDHAIYRGGFLRVAPMGRHLEHADGTPFLYLGDTHWVLPHERWDSSNAPGVASQFRHLVDLRVHQGFTVYQSEPIWRPHVAGVWPHEGADEEAVADLSTGFEADDLAGFANLDRKFAYIAERGLVHANAQVTWVLDPADHPDVFTEEFMYRMGRYWVARYGSYPVIWTIGQEIDPTMYGKYSEEKGNLGVWFAVARAIEDHDAYGHVIMPHMENTGSATASASMWKDHSFHHAFGTQVETWNTHAARDFWDQTPPKPTVMYETRYDGFWIDDEGALAAAYKSFQVGFFGYGYGASGIWNDVYSRPGEPLDAGTDYELPERYTWWFDGAEKPAAQMLAHFRAFYESVEWWRLEPRFDDPRWSVLADGTYLATIERATWIVALDHPSAQSSNGMLRGMDAVAHTASWFDPRTGDEVPLGDPFTPEHGEWRLPPAPSDLFWMLRVTRSS
ncbi:apiosidase-like domain-containing protein [Microbacterium tumbae]